MFLEVSFSKKEKVCKWSKHGLPLRAWREKTVNGVERHWLFAKETVPCTVVIKEGHADSLLGCERANHHWFPRKNMQL